MNENEKMVTNKNAITIIVTTLAINATIGVATMAYCLLVGGEPNSALLTAFVAIVNFLLGALSGMLVKTSPSEATKAIDNPPPPPPPPPSNGEPTPVKLEQPASDPVPVHEVAP